MFVVRASLVKTDALKRSDTFFVGQEFGTDGRVREKEDNENATSDSESTKDEVQELPWCNGAFEESDSVGDGTSNNGRGKIAGVEPPNARRTLILLVPHANYENKTRRDTGLEHTKKETESVETRKVMAYGMKHDDGTPDDYMAAEILGDGEFLANVLRGKHPDKKSHVKCLSYIVIPYSVDGEVHDGCVGQDVLV